MSKIEIIRKHWEPLAGRKLSDEECAEIANNVNDFFQALKEMKKELDQIKQNTEEGI